MNTIHEAIVKRGLRQLEWDHGGQFYDSNRVVDRHNREILVAFEMGKTASNKNVGSKPSDEELVRYFYDLCLTSSELVYERTKDGIEIDVPSMKYKALAMKILKWKSA